MYPLHHLEIQRCWNCIKIQKVAGYCTQWSSQSCKYPVHAQTTPSRLISLQNVATTMFSFELLPLPTFPTCLMPGGCAKEAGEPSLKRERWCSPLEDKADLWNQKRKQRKQFDFLFRLWGWKVSPKLHLWLSETNCPDIMREMTESALEMPENVEYQVSRVQSCFMVLLIQ